MFVVANNANSYPRDTKIQVNIPSLDNYIYKPFTIESEPTFLDIAANKELDYQYDIFPVNKELEALETNSDNKDSLIVHPSSSLSDSGTILDSKIVPYKIALLGDKGSGKSSFIRRHIYGTFLDAYQPTLYPINNSFTLSLDNPSILKEKKCLIALDIIEIPIKQVGNLPDNLHGIFLMVDMSYPNIQRKTTLWLRKLPDIPTVVIFNKMDKNSKPLYRRRGHNIVTRIISVKYNRNIEDPFLDMAKLILKSSKWTLDNLYV